MISYLMLLSALIVSGTSAYFSIVGLTAIFGGSFWSVIIMGGALEFCKLVSASWLYRHWTTAPFLIKAYLTFAVVVLVCISSLGIFGYLSRSHIESTVNSRSADTVTIAQVDVNINNLRSQIDDYSKQIAQIDGAIQKMIDAGKAKGSLSASKDQRKQRDLLISKKDASSKELADLQVKKAGLDVSQKKIEAEVGPLRYVADAMYGQAGEDQLEKAVRILICIFVSVFDPLAIVGLIAANHGINTKKELIPTKESAISISHDDIFRMS